MKKKLLIIAGAGASLEFGMPTVADVDSIFESIALNYLPLASNPNSSLYTWVKDNLETYYKKNPKNRLGFLMGFENILFNIQALGERYKDSQWNSFNHGMNAFSNNVELPDIIAFEKQRQAEGYDFQNLQSYLVDDFLAKMRQKCDDLQNTKKTEISLMHNFISSLQEEFEIGIINLNYDNVIHKAAPNLKTGFDQNGIFDRNQVHNKDWNFCYNIHGSVHFRFDREDNSTLPVIKWENDLLKHPNENSSGRSGQSTSEGKNHLTSTIIAGLDKANQVLRDPFGTYFSKLNELVYHSDSVLFMGYGFADYHLNKAFPWIRFDESKTRKVAIIDYANNQQDGLSYRHDDWTYGLFNTVPYNTREIHPLRSRLPLPVSHFKTNSELETSVNSSLPLAIWYNGMIEACRNSEKIIRELY